jgi:hypothetical protein
MEVLGSISYTALGEIFFYIGEYPILHILGKSGSEESYAYKSYLDQ